MGNGDGVGSGGVGGGAMLAGLVWRNHMSSL